jgi:prolyl oligopeptidase PreP (S9A serine peptidase family)
VTILPEQTHAVLGDASLTNEKYLLLQYLHNVQSKLFVIPLESLETNSHRIANGKIHANGSIFNEELANEANVAETNDEWIGLADAEQLGLPVGCSVDSTSCRRENSRIFIHCVGYTLAGRVYEYKFNSLEILQANRHIRPTNKEKKAYGKLSVWRESVVDGFEPDQWSVEQVWVPNPNDGVKVPMYIVRDKSLVKTGDSFCLLYGFIHKITFLIIRYGGFNISLTPSFSPSMATMLTHTGGLYCVANIRGGGEFGEDWHKAAIREKRPVAFVDFEECGRYLIREGWTRKEKLVCQGGSNGGALIGAVMNRAGEEIFAAGIAQVGYFSHVWFG